jgi:hypothetical protein
MSALIQILDTLVPSAWSVAGAAAPGAADADTRERLAAMLQFFELLLRWADQARKLPTPSLIRMVKMGDKLGKFLGR